MQLSNRIIVKELSTMNGDKFDFETAMTELEEIVNLLESGKVSLEESLKLYEKGIKLVREANNLLSEAKERVKKLSAEM